MSYKIGDKVSIKKDLVVGEWYGGDTFESNMKTEPPKYSIHKAICNDLNEIYKKKNNDYGDSFKLVRDKVPNAIMVRIYDKVNRLENLLGGADQKVNDESIEDTLLDLANYCIMEVVERTIDKEK